MKEFSGSLIRSRVCLKLPEVRDPWQYPLAVPMSQPSDPEPAAGNVSHQHGPQLRAVNISYKFHNKYYPIKPYSSHLVMRHLPSV